MDVYIYQADIYCEDCGEELKKEIVQAHRFTLSEENMLKDDSDMWPQGPYYDGGGEADSPQHCGRCSVALDNPLTEDGSAYVKQAWLEFVQEGYGRLDVLTTWRDNYPCEFTEFGESLEPNEAHLTDLAQRRLDELMAR